MQHYYVHQSNQQFVSPRTPSWYKNGTDRSVMMNRNLKWYENTLILGAEQSHSYINTPRIHVKCMAIVGAGSWQITPCHHKHPVGLSIGKLITEPKPGAKILLWKIVLNRNVIGNKNNKWIAKFPASTSKQGHQTFAWSVKMRWSRDQVKSHWSRENMTQHT